jgi:hypothetical protein
LWRLNLTQEDLLDSGDQDESHHPYVIPHEPQTELTLSAEDREFLLQVGIKT